MSIFFAKYLLNDVTSYVPLVTLLITITLTFIGWRLAARQAAADKARDLLVTEQKQRELKKRQHLNAFTHAVRFSQKVDFGWRKAIEKDGLDALPLLSPSEHNLQVFYKKEIPGSHRQSEILVLFEADFDESGALRETTKDFAVRLGKSLPGVSEILGCWQSSFTVMPIFYFQDGGFFNKVSDAKTEVCALIEKAAPVQGLIAKLETIPYEFNPADKNFGAGYLITERLNNGR